MAYQLLSKAKYVTIKKENRGVKVEGNLFSFFKWNIWCVKKVDYTIYFYIYDWRLDNEKNIY